MKIGYGHLTKDLNEGLKASKKIGGSVIESVGWMSYSITGAIFKIKLSNKCSVSRFSIAFTSIA